MQEKYLSEHNYDEPIDVDSTLKLLNFGDDYSKFIDSMSDEFSDLDPATVKPQRTKRKIRRQSTVNKVCTIENNTNLNSIFCLIKSSKNDFIFLPAFYLILWLMTSPKNFEKIAILKI